MISKLITLWVQLRDLYLYIFRRAIIVNGYVDDHTWRGIRHRNWGDDLNYYFLRKLTGRPVVMYHNFKLAKWFHLKNFLCIGTLLDAVKYSNKQTVVWGSGVSGLERTIIHPQKILAVRGKETKKFLERYNIDCPSVWGDPAVLLTYIYNPPYLTRKTYKLGIIPNIADWNHPVIEEIRLKAKNNILLIDMADYDNWLEIIDKIRSCDYILSSSLHGLIVSDVYQIPNCWISLSGKAIVGSLKFHDYLSSVGRKCNEPIKVKNLVNITDMINNANMYFSCASMKHIKKLQQGLLAVAPFKCKIGIS